MIDKIVMMIVSEAATRPGKDRVTALLAVMMEVDAELIKVIVTARDIEREAKKNENKG